MRLRLRLKQFDENLIHVASPKALKSLISGSVG